MKSYRVDVHKGINNIGDKAVIAEGFVSVADGVDLRSGTPRPFYMPQFNHEVPVGTKCAFEFKDQWFHSTDYREYSAEYMNGHSMVYWTGEGLTPQKWIDGSQATLGAIIPTATPTVASTSSLRTTLTGGPIYTSGNYQGGEIISYRVAPRTKYGVMPPSNRYSIKIPVKTESDDSRGGFISWTSNVDEVLGWQIFIGPDGQEQFYVELGPTATSYTDLGVGVGNGPLATTYSVETPYSYIYTFVRDVNGIIDESGPSYPSNEVSSEAGRHITLDTMNDGYWQQSGSSTVNLGYTPTEILYSERTYTLGGWNSVANLYKIVSTDDHGLATGDRVYFGGSVSPNFPNVEIEIIADISDPKVFYIAEDIGSGGNQPAWYRPLRTEIYDATAAITDGDYLKVEGTDNSVDTTFGVFKAGATGATAGYFNINLYTTTAWTGASATNIIETATFYSNNNYYKYRNLYRTGDSSDYQLVTQLELSESEFDDAVSVQYLGGVPDSYYSEVGPAGIPQTISFLPPPDGMRSIVTHYGMKFGIDGHIVRWTPVNRPDAWPQLYTLSFAFQPVRLISYDQSLFVFCLDAVYRIDGTNPNGLSCMITKALDGCIAPNSVQVVNNNILYLSRRGVMLFNGSSADCITDMRINPLFWQGTSFDQNENFWIKPTLSTYNYANMAMDDGIRGSNDDSYILSGTLALGGANYAIRSFKQNGKYFLYWAQPYNNYTAHTTVCIDLQAPDTPVTTLPIKPFDAHTSSDGTAYVLIQADETSAKAIRDAIENMGDSATYSPSTDMGVFKFGADRTIKIPFHLRTGANSLGLPMVRKRFSGVRLHGSDPTGTYRIRIYIDDRYACEGRVVTVTNPNKIRQANIPVNACVGYTIDVELSGDSFPRALEFIYDYIASEVDSGKG